MSRELYGFLVTGGCRGRCTIGCFFGLGPVVARLVVGLLDRLPENGQCAVKVGQETV